MSEESLLQVIQEQLGDEIGDDFFGEVDPALKGFQNVVDKLTDKHHKIGIEFECGDCCKKVINGSRLFFVFGLAILLPAKGDCLFVKLFSGGKLVDKEIVRAIVIPVKRICSIEIEPVQVDP